MVIKNCPSLLTRIIVLMILMFLSSSCGGNFFESMSGQTSHDAFVQDIRNLVNDLKFDEAIAMIENASSFQAANRDEMLLIASAYAGSCGVTFADVFESLATATGSPMYFMMSSFTTKVLQPSRCHTAQQWIEQIGNSASRTTTENVAMFLVGFGKVGTYLRNRADTNASGIGDGTVDVGYDSCSNASLPIDEVKQVMTGFGLMIDNISALGTNVSGDLSSNIGVIDTACTTFGFSCSETDPTAIADGDADLFRNAVKSHSTTQVGIETCDPLSPLCCP